MAPKNENQRLIVIKSRGFIRNLRSGMQGPISSPFYLDITTVKLIVQEGHEVHFVNRTNWNETVKITLENIRKTQEELFGKKEEKKAEPKKEEAAPVKEEVKKEEAPKAEPQKPQQNQKNNRQQQNNKPVEDAVTQPK